jgi:hypothetical protein
VWLSMYVKYLLEGQMILVIDDLVVLGAPGASVECSMRCLCTSSAPLCQNVLLRLMSYEAVQHVK